MKVMGEFCAFIPDLAAIRNRRGISLRKIADMTKIPVFYLKAIEKGEFEKLPGGVYTKSYVRQYAEAIDYDADELLRSIAPVSEPEAPAAPALELTPWRRLVRFVMPPFMAGAAGVADRVKIRRVS